MPEDLWDPENLKEKEAARMAGIEEKSLRTAKAYQMRLVLQDIYRSPTAGVARHRFRVWCRWVRWVARRQPKNLLRSLVKVAEMVEKHLEGILAHWKWCLRAPAHEAYREESGAIMALCASAQAS